MSAINNLLNDVTDIATDGSTHTRLEDFLQKFNDPAGKYVNTIDPLGTFDVNIRFYPSIDPADLNMFDKMLNSAVGAATNAISNAANNITGGLVSSLLSKTSLYSSNRRIGGKLAADVDHTFIEYLAKENLIVGGEKWLCNNQSLAPLELQLGLYVQSISVPNIKMPDGQKCVTSLGEFPVNGNFITSDGTLQLEILNTKAALHERIFYPWMREVTLPYWSYEKQPYTTATITIDYTKHNDVKYVFCGCRPCQISLLQGTQESSSENITRNITIMFDYMYITSGLKVIDSAVDKLIGSAGSLASGALNTFNM